MNVLETLNPEQVEAVTATEGPVRVIAGPGTGKTRTLTRRYCHLVSDLGVNPRNVLCATFTNRAAGEMKSRIREALGDLDLGHICTLHSFCVRILRQDIHRLGFPKEFAILDVDDQKTLLGKIFSDMNLTMEGYTIQRAFDEVLEARKLSAGGYVSKLHLLDNESLRREFETCLEMRDEIFLRYLYEQKKSFAVDFNDLINLAVYLLETFVEVRERWQDLLEYVMVDEFQDVSARQYKLAAILAGKHNNLFIVGDPDQTIYTWLGSHTRLLTAFDQRHPGTKTVILTRGYRSVPEVVAAAKAVIVNNPGRIAYDPVAERPPGARPKYFRAETAKGEAEFIVSEIKRLASEKDLKLSDSAVIYRAHHQSRSLEEALVAAKIPYRLFSGVEFYKRAEIKDVICWLRMLSAADDPAFLRTVKTPRRRLGKKRLQALAARAEELGGLTLYQALKRSLGSELLRGTLASEYAYAIETVKKELGRSSLGDTLQRLLDLSGYEAHMRLQGDQERLDNLSELKRSIIDFGQDEEATLDDFLARAALFSNLDKDSAEETVKLLTIHSAKGLEFSAVFLCGMSEGQLPIRRAVTVEAMEEERRLCYVAMTRAKDYLYLTESGERGHDNLYKVTSRFVMEAGEERVDFLTPPDLGPPKRPAPAPLPLGDLLEEGRRVEHEYFGLGTVVEVNLAAGGYLIRFDKLATCRSIRFGASLKALG
ncbi:MAG: ATP-dependent helicase [Deltaproteobacteria bacterium]|nr:ATP-dependent helicase [Deltaproteobacteria bacterium]